MIEYEIYSIKDVVTGTFHELVLHTNRESAIRYFRGLCAESKIKNDLQLFSLGTYNIETGDIVSKVDFVMGGSDCE